MLTIVLGQLAKVCRGDSVCVFDTIQKQFKRL